MGLLLSEDDLFSNPHVVPLGDPRFAAQSRDIPGTPSG